MDFSAIKGLGKSPKALRRKIALIDTAVAEHNREHSKWEASQLTEAKAETETSAQAAILKVKPNTAAKARSRADRIGDGQRRLPDIWVRTDVLDHYQSLAAKQSSTVTAVVARVLTRAVPRRAKPPALPLPVDT
jgi:hypothetical protein